MKKVLYYLSFVVLGGLLFLFLKYEYPKELSRFPIFIMIILMDVYLWKTISKHVFLYSGFLKGIIIGLFWLPLIALAGIVVSSFFIPALDWNDSIRTYLFGFIFIAYAAKLLPAVILLLKDIFRLVKYLIRNKKKEVGAKNQRNKISRAEFIEKVGLGSGVLVFGTLFTGMFKWSSDFKIHDVKVKIARLPKAFQSYKIVQLSDMHLGSWTSLRPMQEAIRIVNSLNPDLIVFTGDLVNYSTHEAYRFKEELSKLRAKDGVYTILGNHDYGDYLEWDSENDKKQNLTDLYKFYEEIGWNLMLNEHVSIYRGGDNIVLAGVENWGHALRFPKYGDLDRTFENLDNKEAVKILLSHDPSHWKAQVLRSEYNIDLMLAGHTHGMQFGIEMKGVKWSPAKWIYKQWAGLYADDSFSIRKYLYVNRGIGVIGYPGRVGILPEISLIELT